MPAVVLVKKKQKEQSHLSSGGEGEREGRGETIFIQLLKTLYYRFYQDSNVRSFWEAWGDEPQGC